MMLSQTTKRLILAGLCVALRAQVGSAQGFGGILQTDGCRGCGTPQQIPTYPAPYVQPYTQPWPQSQPMSTMPPLTPIAPKSPDGKTPEAKAPEAAPEPKLNNQDFQPQPLTSAALGDTQFAMASPQIMGDFAGYSARRTFFVPSVQTTTTTVVTNGGGAPPVVITSTFINPRNVIVPVTVDVPVVSRAGSGFKIAENESPIPTDRVFFTYNYFDGLRGQPGAFAGTTIVGPVSAPVLGVGGAATTTQSTTTTAPVVVAPNASLNREIFGFEKTFLGGDASFEVRVPIYQSSNSALAVGGGGSGFAGDDFGDITTVFKFALVHDSDRVFSVGLATSFPTAPTIMTDAGNVRAVLFQPFVGLYRSYGNLFFEGFSSVVISTSSMDPTLVFNDYAVGYRLYQTQERRLVKSVSPALELHVTTPLDSDNTGGTLFVPDVVSFTGAVHVGLGDRSNVSFGCNVPVTGPRPYNAEALVQLNWRF